MAKAAMSRIRNTLPPPQETMIVEIVWPMPERLTIDTMMPAQAQAIATDSVLRAPSSSAPSTGPAARKLRLTARATTTAPARIASKDDRPFFIINAPQSAARP